MRTVKIIIVYLCLFLGPSLAAGDSTFVGNGGSAGDVEIGVAIRHLQETLDLIAAGVPDDRSLCSCPKAFENHPLCTPLADLGEKKTEFCARFLKDRAGELRELTSGRQKVDFLWTHDPVRLEERYRNRAADAVADRDKRSITINLERFLEMKNYDRLFIVTHELLHFTQLDGKPLTDEGTAGPYDGTDGSRRLLNAAAAATALVAADEGVLKRYRGAFRRPQSWRHHYFDFDLGFGSTERSPAGPYGLERYSRTNLSFRYYPAGSWGLVAGWKSESSSEKVLGTVSLNEKIDTFALGLSYRWFIFHNPLTYLGQSHLVFNALAGLQKASQSINDGDTELADSAVTPSYELSAFYHLPVFWRFWVYFGMTYEIQSHRYSNFPATYDMNKTFVSTGASYAF